MTFLEKAKEICKEKGETFDEKEIIKKCPEECGLENESECMIIGECACIECWNREMPLKCPNSTRMMNREMPNTEPKADEDKEWFNGYEKGKIDGLNDAWELVKNCWNMSVLDTREIFGYEYVNGILENFTPQEVLAKLKAYEEAQIEVGDVLGNDKNDMLVIVTKVYDTAFDCIDNSGIVRASFDKTLWKKTGKHIDIKSILESIGE